MPDQTPSLAQLDPTKVHACIASSLRQLANYHDQLASMTPAGEAKPADKPANAKAEKPAKAKAKADKPAEDDAPEMTPEQIAADLKAKLVALVGKDRAKAVALVATVGAKNFSTIPVEKHAEMLRKVDDALNPKAEDDDPLA